MENNKITIKSMLIGSQGVGKTTLLLKIRNENEVTNFIGYTYSAIHYGNITFSIWDDGGCVLYNSLYEKIYNQTEYFIFVYDPFNAETFEDAKFWCFYLNKYKVSIFLIVETNGVSRK